MLIIFFRVYRLLGFADWLRAHEMWMDNPILNIDADAIEGTTTDMYKMMVRLIRVFADIEAVQVRSEVLIQLTSRNNDRLERSYRHKKSDR